MSSASSPRIEAHPGFLRVHFGAGTPAHADFHWLWLRHWCDCCRHPQTRERTLDAADLPLDPHPASALLTPDGATLELGWSEAGGRHRTVYSLDWLREHAYAPDREDVPPPSAEVAPLIIDAASTGDLEKLIRAGIDRVQERGAAVLRGGGLDTEALIDAFARTELHVIETHFGRIEDLRTDNTTNANTDQLGYTDAPVDLHTDQPFLPEPPRYQMLHCMRPADQGGDSVVADGRQAALHLRSVDRQAFDLITTVPVVFHRQQKAFDKRLVSPLVELRDGEFFRVRSSYFTFAPHRIPFDTMEAWYRAYARFTGLLRDPRHQVRFRLEAGDALLYDNFRMLHARTGFQGARWVRGVYFDR
jgi:gamma-butyrobetaine dioxygenase/trimethyllysine dioxygenase